MNGACFRPILAGLARLKAEGVITKGKLFAYGKGTVICRVEVVAPGEPAPGQYEDVKRAVQEAIGTAGIGIGIRWEAWITRVAT